MILLAALAAAVAAVADEPPSWSPFRICTESGRFCARVEAAGEPGEAPWSRGYRLTVTRTDAGGNNEAWTTEYGYDGYPGGLLASDGMTFVDVSFWYYADSPVVRIYREGRRIDIDGNAFGIANSDLVETASHRLWLTERAPRYDLVDASTLRIRTIDGNTHLVDLATGVVKH